MASKSPTPDFKNIFDLLPGIYLILAPDFTMVAANQARFKATMTTPEDTLGRNLFDLFPDNPDDPSATGTANLRASLLRVLETKKPDTMAVQRYDIRRSEAEGGGFEVRYWSPMNSPVLDAQDNVAYIVHRVEDVTEFMRLKEEGAEKSKLTEELRAKIEKTEMEIYQRAQEVQGANKKLRELDRAKTEFFSNVSHELRTPLTLILAPLESQLASAELSPVQRENIQMAHNNAVRLLQLVNGLLDFSKLAAEKMKVQREPIQLLDLTRSLFLDFKPLMEQKGIRGDLTANLPSHAVEMDRYMYERILFNLVSNAVKFTPKNGKVALAAEWTEGRLSLSVTDSGIGISEEDQKDLFQRFHQAEGSSTRRFEGTGLGLAMVKEFALLLGGSVSVKSAPDKGSTFTVLLNAPKASASKNEMAVQPQAAYGSAITIPVGFLPKAVERKDEGEDLPKVLVAEDNPELAHFISGLLSSFCLVRRAPDGEEALEQARIWSPDLILSDVMMPKMDGIQLTREIKSNKETAAIPVVLLTAMTGRDSLMQGWEAGADDYLFKPFHPKELEARIRSLLSMVQWRQKSRDYRRQRDSLEQFTHIASHDLREPLRKIVSFTRLFEEKMQNKVDEETAGYLEVITRSATRMVGLMDLLMEFSRLDKDTPIMDRADLNGVLKNVLDGFALELKQTGCRITAQELPVVRAAPGQIALVLQNLIGNSLKYRSGTTPPEIKIGAMKRRSEWIFSVEDNGIGFEPEQAENIFIMFERLHSREKYPGEGMGLAICRKIVENHGGRIWAEAQPGKGASFHFTLRASD